MLYYFLKYTCFNLWIFQNQVRNIIRAQLKFVILNVVSGFKNKTMGGYEQNNGSCPDG